MENTLEKSFVNNQLGIKLNPDIDEKLRVWFKAKEVALILGYKNTDDAIKRHVSENHKRTFLLSCPRESRGQVIKSCRGGYITEVYYRAILMSSLNEIINKLSLVFITDVIIKYHKFLIVFVIHF